MTPPITQPRKGSSVATKPVMANRSTSTELSPIPASEPNRNSGPKCRQATRNSGMFITMMSTPTGRPVSWLTIMAMPVTPPEVMLFG